MGCFTFMDKRINLYSCSSNIFSNDNRKEIMIKVDNVAIWGFKHAIRGMRNPLNSWDKSDSYFEDDIDVNSKAFSLGENDLDLMKRLFNAGPEHRKYLRQIIVSMDITAPLYW